MRDKLERLASRIYDDVQLLAWRRMAGGSSARTLELELGLADGGARRVVARQYGERDLSQNPCVAECEYRLLSVAARLGLPTPKPLLLGEPGRDWPSAFIVIERVDGEPDFAPRDLDAHLRQMAGTLAAIHAVDADAAGLDFLPPQADSVASRLRRTPNGAGLGLSQDRIADALRAVWPLRSRNRPSLLHGDFWPGNVLWKQGKLAAVIDWEDARIGEPLSDLANARLELMWAFGWDAARRFTRMYQDAAQVDAAHLPYWDLCAALGTASNFGAIADGWASAPTPGRAAGARELRVRHGQFADDALAQLADWR